MEAQAPSHRTKPAQRTTLQSHHLHQRSLSPSGRFCSSTIAASAPPSLTRRESQSPAARVAISRPPSSSAVRFAAPHHQTGAKKMTCMCSPTTHPGSFRCSLHKSSRFPGYNGQNTRKNHHHGGVSGTASYQLNIASRSGMTNSLVRIGTVEGDLVKRALAALIRPSSHSQRRREDFKPRPSRLSVMARAEGS